MGFGDQDSGFRGQGFRVYSPPEVDGIWGIYGDLTTIYPMPHSIYLRGAIRFRAQDSRFRGQGFWDAEFGVEP